jgi:geranylgeranyl pyrophosphate synthase
VTQMILRYESIEYSLGRAEDYIASALQETEQLPQGPARDSLEKLAHYVLSRSH